MKVAEEEEETEAVEEELLPEVQQALGGISAG